MSFYEDLVMQSQMNYSKYYGVYKSGKTPIKLSQRTPPALSGTNPGIFRKDIRSGLYPGGRCFGIICDRRRRFLLC